MSSENIYTSEGLLDRVVGFRKHEKDNSMGEAILLMSWKYGDSKNNVVWVRYCQAVDTLARSVVSYGSKAVVVNDGLPEEFKKHLARVVEIIDPNKDRVKFIEGGCGLSGGRLKALNEAWDSGRGKNLIVFWTEEKPYIPDFAGRVIDDMRRRSSDIMVIGRTDESMSTWPDYQRNSETYANRKINQSLHEAGMLAGQVRLDFMHGPRAIRLTERTLKVFNTGWEIVGLADKEKSTTGKFLDLDAWARFLIIPVVYGLGLGLEVGGIDIDCQYPDAQKKAEIEELNSSGNKFWMVKRRQQALNMILSAREVIKYIQGKDSRLKINQS